MIALAACYWLCDVKLKRGWWTKPFIIFGSNAIAAYTLADLVASSLYSIKIQSGQHSLTLQDWLYRVAFAWVPSKPLASLAYSTAFVLVCWLPIYWMYRRRIFLKV